MPKQGWQGRKVVGCKVFLHAEHCSIGSSWPAFLRRSYRSVSPSMDARERQCAQVSFNTTGIQPLPPQTPASLGDEELPTSDQLPVAEAPLPIKYRDRAEDRHAEWLEMR